MQYLVWDKLSESEQAAALQRSSLVSSKALEQSVSEIIEPSPPRETKPSGSTVSALIISPLRISPSVRRR